MAIDAGKNIIDAVTLSTTVTTILTVTNNLLRTKLDSIAFTNFGTGNEKITAHSLYKAISACSSNILIKAKEMRKVET